MKYIVFILLLSLFIFCGKNTNNECVYAAVPNSFFFTIKKNGQTLSNQILDSVKISYFDNSSKKYISDLSYAIDYYANKGILTSRNIGSLSGNMEIKTYYIEYPSNLKTDTIFVDYNKPSINNGCVYTLAAVKFNTKVAVIDTFKYQPVYLFEKL